MCNNNYLKLTLIVHDKLLSHNNKSEKNILCLIVEDKIILCQIAVKNNFFRVRANSKLFIQRFNFVSIGSKLYGSKNDF